MDKAALRLSRGRKYGLVGRNGIGKTTLINALCRKELDKCPQNLHILQVEQEVEGDDKSVLTHVIECDVERLELLAEQEELTNKDIRDLEDYEKTEHNERMIEVAERLEMIEHTKAEAKAIEILTGLGFK